MEIWKIFSYFKLEFQINNFAQKRNNHPNFQLDEREDKISDLNAELLKINLKQLTQLLLRTRSYLFVKCRSCTKFIICAEY
jgi:hypothetical protein